MKKIFLLLISLFLLVFGNTTFANISKIQEARYIKVVDDFYIGFEKRIENIDHDIVLKALFNIEKNISNQVRNTDNEVKKFVYNYLSKKVNGTIVEYMDSYPLDIIKNHTYKDEISGATAGENSHIHQILANKFSDVPQEISRFYNKDGDLIMNMKEFRETGLNRYVNNYPRQVTLLDLNKSTLFYEGFRFYNPNLSNDIGNNDKKLSVFGVNKITFGSKFELEKYVAETMLPWIKYYGNYQTFISKNLREPTVIEIIGLYRQSQGIGITQRELATLDAYYSAVPNYSILY